MDRKSCSVMYFQRRVSRRSSFAQYNSELGHSNVGNGRLQKNHDWGLVTRNYLQVLQGRFSTLCMHYNIFLPGKDQKVLESINLTVLPKSPHWSKAPLSSLHDLPKAKPTSWLNPPTYTKYQTSHYISFWNMDRWSRLTNFCKMYQHERKISVLKSEMMQKPKSLTL